MFQQLIFDVKFFQHDAVYIPFAFYLFLFGAFRPKKFSNLPTQSNEKCLGLYA